MRDFWGVHRVRRRGHGCATGGGGRGGGWSLTGGWAVGYVAVSMVVGKETAGGGARLGGVLSVVLLAVPGFTVFAQEAAAGAAPTTRPGEGLPRTGGVQVRGFEIE